MFLLNLSWHHAVNTTIRVTEYVTLDHQICAIGRSRISIAHSRNRRRSVDDDDTGGFALTIHSAVQLIDTDSVNLSLREKNDHPMEKHDRPRAQIRRSRAANIIAMKFCLTVVCAEVDKDCTPHCPPNPKNYQAICSFGRCMCYGCGCGWIFNDWGVEMQEVINRRAVIRM